MRYGKWKWTHPNSNQNLLFLLPYLWTLIIFHLISLHWLILKKRQGQKIEASPPCPSLNPHHHHHFHHYMKYDREHNPTMPCKCRRGLASRRHKRYACIIWPGEHHLWGDSQRLEGGDMERRGQSEEERIKENGRGRGIKAAEQQKRIQKNVKREWGTILGRK